MNEEFDPSKYDPDQLISFQFNRPQKGDSQMDVCIHYQSAHADISWEDTEQGNRNLARLFMAFPKIREYIRKEVAIKQEVEEIDQDLLDLLQDGDSE